MDDGSFSLTGQKIFITSGDHDLTENIIHLVLQKYLVLLMAQKALVYFLYQNLM